MSYVQNQRRRGPEEKNLRGGVCFSSRRRDDWVESRPPNWVHTGGVFLAVTPG